MLEALRHKRRPLCRACLEWSVRTHHLEGALGAALLSRCFALGWARRAQGSRAVNFSALGEKALRERFRRNRNDHAAVEQTRSGPPRYPESTRN